VIDSNESARATFSDKRTTATRNISTSLTGIDSNTPGSIMKGNKVPMLTKSHYSSFNKDYEKVVSLGKNGVSFNPKLVAKRNRLSLDLLSFRQQQNNSGNLVLPPRNKANIGGFVVDNEWKKTRSSIFRRNLGFETLSPEGQVLSESNLYSLGHEKSSASVPNEISIGSPSENRSFPLSFKVANKLLSKRTLQEGDCTGTYPDDCNISCTDQVVDLSLDIRQKDGKYFSLLHFINLLRNNN
jgi:hypothetical protein